VQRFNSVLIQEFFVVSADEEPAFEASYFKVIVYRGKLEIDLTAAKTDSMLLTVE